MSIFEPKEVCETVVVNEDSDFKSYLLTNPTGLLIVPESDSESEGLLLPSDAGDFAKWVKQTEAGIKVEMRRADRCLVRKSGDYWLPLVFLATDITLTVYLNIVANYLYDKMKGALRSDTARVHLSVVYEDKKAGIVKRFNFDGDLGTLEKTIKKFDLNKFLDE